MAMRVVNLQRPGIFQVVCSGLGTTGASSAMGLIKLVRAVEGKSLPNSATRA